MISCVVAHIKWGQEGRKTGGLGGWKWGGRKGGKLWKEEGREGGGGERGGERQEGGREEGREGGRGEGVGGRERCGMLLLVVVGCCGDCSY